MSQAWRPGASQEVLRHRAALLRTVRDFFETRGVLEVSTPVLGRTGPPDPHLSLVECRFPGQAQTFYLQPSPESAMKRLLAAGSGPIYQIGPAFRAGEQGRRHNPEFSMLEWYRPGYSLQELADETDDLLALVLAAAPARRVSYRQVFTEHVGLDPFQAANAELEQAARGTGLERCDALDRDSLLDLLFSHRVEPALGRGVVQVFDFPASQAAMALVEGEMARRMEVYVDGMELANAYQELTDAAEQGARFERALDQRRRQGIPVPPMDQPLLDALESGLPRCAGIAVGFDRLVMLSMGLEQLDQVLAFPFARC